MRLSALIRTLLLSIVCAAAAKGAVGGVGGTGGIGLGDVTNAVTGIVGPNKTFDSTQFRTNTGPIQFQPGTPIILDTDLGFDPDDSGDVCLAHGLMDNGELNILAEVSCMTNFWAGPCMSAFNYYYGRPWIPVGAIYDDGTYGLGLNEVDYYGSFTATNNYQQLGTTRNCPDVIPLLRQVLVSQPTNSVYYVCTGPLRNIYQLYRSPADSISPLTGAQLCYQKIREFVLAAGQYPFSPTPEYNIQKDGGTATIVHSISNRITWTGYEVGVLYRTGSNYWKLPPANPLREAFHLGLNAIGSTTNDRPGWGQIALLYAARGSNYLGSNYWTSVSTGTNFVDGVFVGTNQWLGNAAVGQQYLVVSADTNGIRDIINSIMLKPPKFGNTNGPLALQTFGGPVVSGQAFTNLSGRTVLLTLTVSLTTSSVSGGASMCMTNTTTGESYNATNSAAVAAVVSDRVTFTLSPRDVFITTNKSSGSASAIISGSTAVKL